MLCINFCRGLIALCVVVFVVVFIIAVARVFWRRHVKERRRRLAAYDAEMKAARERTRDLWLEPIPPTREVEEEEEVVPNPFL